MSEEEFYEQHLTPPTPLEPQTKFYDIEEDEQTEHKRAAQLQIVYDELQKDHQQLRQEHVYKDAVIRDLTKKLEENEKMLNDVIIHTEAKKESLKNLRIEVSHKLLYSLALDWSTRPQSVFVCCDRDTGEVTLKTADEIGDKKPTYRHWWLSEKPIEGVN